MAQATLYNPTTKVRKAVEAGSAEAQALFGQGYALETGYNPVTKQTVYNTPTPKAEPAAPVIGSAWGQTAPATADGTTPTTAPTPAAKNLRYRTSEDGTPKLTGEQAAAQRELTDAEKASLREEVYSGVQTQLDAIDLAAKNILARYQTQEQGSLGRNRAVAAAGGSIGSPTQDAQIKDINDTYNAKEAEAVAAAEADKAAIRSNAEARLQNRIANARANKISNLDYAQQYDEKQQAQAKDDMVNFIKSGGDLSKYSDEELKDIQKETGWSALQFELVAEANKPAAAKIDYDFSWKGDTLVGYGIDPKTGKVVTKTFNADEMGIPAEDRTKSLKFITNPDTQEVYYYDEKNPDKLTKIGTAGTGQKLTTKEVNVGKTTFLITYDKMGNEVKRENMGVGGGTGGNGGGNNNSIDGSNYDKQKSQLEATKDANGFINTDEYKRIRNSLKSATLKNNFDKDFSFMLNPADPSASDYVTKTDRLDADTAIVQSTLFDARDTQGYVTPETYNNARNAWISDGYSPADFDKKFSQYINSANKKQYQGAKITKDETADEPINWGDTKKEEKKWWEIWK